MKIFWITTCTIFLFAGTAGSQVSVDVSDYGVHIQQGGNVKVQTKANNSGGIIGSDVQIEGEAIINGDVFIDGEKIPKGKKIYTSKKTKKTYLLQWGENGNISVSEK